MPLKQQAQETIQDWTDCWFGDTRRTGYVTVTDLVYQRSYGAKDIKALIRNTKGLEKSFMSLNAFTFGSRKTADLKQIRNIGIDLDQYKLDITIEDAIDQLHALIMSKVIPEPNMVLTSRGIQLFYSIRDGAAPDMAWLASYITDQFIGKTKNLGSDSNAKDVSRLMRVPNSVNERNGAIVRPEIWNPMPYTLQELQDFCKPLEDFSTRRKKKAKVMNLIPPKHHDKLSFLYRTNFLRIQDFETLIELRGGDMTHKRNQLLYVYAFHQALITNSFADLEVFLNEVYKKIHSKDNEKLTKTEFKRTIKSAYEDARRFFEHFKANGYKVVYAANDGLIKPYKNDSLIEMFDITEEEQRQMRSVMGSVVAKEKDAERKRKKRREEGAKTHEEYQKSRKDTQTERLKKLYTFKRRFPEATNAELASKLGVSTKTIQRLSKML